jgi:type IV pilus assembly protein PilN
MIRINLLSTREIQAEVGRRQDIVVAVLALGTALVCCVAVFGYQIFRSAMLERESTALRAEINSMEAQTKEVSETQAINTALKQKIAVLEDLDKKKTGPVHAMETLSGAAPERLWVTEFKENSGNLAMNGMAVDNQTVADFLKALAASDYYKDVELVETTQAQQDKLALKKFSLKSRLLYQPEAGQPAKVIPLATSASGGAAKK